MREAKRRYFDEWAEREKGQKNMDFKRITSGFIVGLVLIVILLIPYNIITGLLFTLIAIVGMHEYLGAISKVCKPVKW